MRTWNRIVLLSGGLLVGTMGRAARAAEPASSAAAAPTDSFEAETSDTSPPPPPNPTGSNPAASDPTGEAPPSAHPYPPCSIEPDERGMAAAKGAFEAGNAAFNEADYRRAITYWEDAYRRDCTAHPMLKNLARAYELDGQYEMAIIALRTYLERQPNSGEGPSIQRRIENLERKLEEQRQQAAPEASPETPEPVESIAPPPAVERERSMVPLIVAGGGAVVGIIGGVIWGSAYSTVQDVERQCPDRVACDPDVANRGNDARSNVTLGAIVTGVGAAVAIGGTIWYFTQPVEEKPVMGWSPEVGLDSAGLSSVGLRYRGAF